MKLKVNVKDVGACEKLLTIDVPEERVGKEFDSFYDAVSNRAKIPGFRPGQAPRKVVALHFKSEARGQVLKQLLAETVFEAVRQESIELIGRPTIEEVEFDENKLKYKAHIETRPKIKLGKYAGLPTEKKVTPVEDSEIEATLKRFQEAHGRFQAVENRPARMGDYLICDYRLISEGAEIEKRDGEWFQIRETDYLEGFSKQLAGASAGETRQVRITFPSDYAREELAGKTGEFELTVKEIKEKVLPALDDEFAKGLGDYESIAGFRQKVRTDLEAHKNAEAEREVERALLDELIKRSKFDLPKGFVQRYLDNLVDEEAERLAYQGMPERDLPAEKEKIRKNLEQEAQRQVRVSFLLDEIAAKERLTAQEADLAKRYQMIAERYRRPAEEVRVRYEQNEEAKRSLMHQLVNEKTIEWLRARANIKERKQRGGGS